MKTPEEISNKISELHLWWTRRRIGQFMALGNELAAELEDCEKDRIPRGREMVKQQPDLAPYLERLEQEARDLRDALYGGEDDKIRLAAAISIFQAEEIDAGPGYSSEGRGRGADDGADRAGRPSDAEGGEGRPWYG